MLRKSFLLLNFWLLAIHCIGQNKIIDSLFVKLQQSIKESDKADYLNQIAYQFHRVDIDSTKYYAERSLELSQNRGLKAAEARALNILSIASIYKGDFEESINYNLKSYEIAQQIDSKYLISIIGNSLSIGYDRLNDYENSITYGKIALEAAQDMQDTTFIAYIITNLSEFHFDEGNFKEARRYTEQVIEIGKRTDDCKLLSLAHYELGKLQMHQSQIEDAESNFKIALKYSDDCQDEYVPSLVYGHMAKISFKKGKPHEANKLIDQSTLMLKNIGEEYNLFDNYLVKSEILKSLNRNEEAINSLLEGLALAENNIDLDFQNKYLERLIKIYSAQGKYDKALDYSLSRHLIQDSISNMNKALAMLELEKKYSVEKKEVEVKLLTEQQNKNEQTIKSRTYLFVASSLLAALIGTLAFFTFLSLRRKAEYSTILEQEVGERTKELQKSNRLLQNSNQELERFAYISSHDLKEPLKNINSFTKLIKKESIESNNTRINEYANILEKCSNQLNTLVSDILDYSMIKSDLKIQSIDLNHIIEQLRSDLDNSININNAIIKAYNLPTIKTDKSSIYRIFKNLIENGIKYNTSGKPKINISAELNTEEIKLVFSDNGIGIDRKYHEDIFTMFNRLHNKDNYAGSGIGLSAVKAIVERLKGTVKVISEPMNGSEFIITLPILT